VKGINYAPDAAHRQMKAVSDLNGVGCTLPTTLHIGTGSVTHDQLNTRMPA